LFGLIGVTRTLWRRRIEGEAVRVTQRVGDGSPLPLDQARALAGEGHFLAAAHHVQLAALQLLLEGRFVELARSEPNATLRRRLARSSLPESICGDFLALLDRLEGHWFRDRKEDRELYLDWCQLHTRLDALGRQP
jgi:HEPN domain-containing protein